MFLLHQMLADEDVKFAGKPFKEAYGVIDTIRRSTVHTLFLRWLGVRVDGTVRVMNCDIFPATKKSDVHHITGQACAHSGHVHTQPFGSIQRLRKTAL